MRVFLTIALAALPAFSQIKNMEQGPNRMELTLERQDASGWRIVDPGTIFQKGDKIRFRYRTNFNGNLYVLNHGTGGSYTQLFPRQDTGMINRVEAGTEYVVPATEGSFRVDGPAGHDVVYWVVTPVALANEFKHTPLPAPPAPSSKAAASLVPRCDDTILRARGTCVDSSAGPKAVTDSDKLPDAVRKMADAGSRDLVFFQKQSRSVVASPAPLGGPVVYEFRLAHK